MALTLQTSREISEYKDIQISTYQNRNATVYIPLSSDTLFTLLFPTSAQGQQKPLSNIHKSVKAYITKTGK